MIDAIMLLVNVTLALVLGTTLGGFLSYPLLGAAGGVLAAIGGRVELGKKRTDTYDPESGALQLFGQSTPAYYQLGYMLRLGVWMVFLGCLGGVLGLFFGKMWQPWGVAFGVIGAFLAPFFAPPLVGYPKHHNDAHGRSKPETPEGLLDNKGVYVNPDNGIWLGALGGSSDVQKQK